MKQEYYKEINGEKVFYRDPLILNGMQIFNPTEEQLLSAGWIKFIPTISKPEFTQEELLSRVIESKIEEIKNYDSSEAVNSCIINYLDQTLQYWADKNERNTLRNAVMDYMEKGNEIYRLDLREYDVSLPISCEILIEILRDLECYAIDCYNVTTDHIFAVKKLTNIEEINRYDYTVGYPAHLTFDIE